MYKTVNSIINELDNYGGRLEVQVMNESGDRFEVDAISTVNTSNGVVVIIEMGAPIE